jgi:putative hydrolase of the HAD superfamily
MDFWRIFPKVGKRLNLLKKAVIFDFGQTLADSANGFRTAEKEAQDKLFSYLGLTAWNDFLKPYRQIRTSFHERSDFSRKDMWVRLCRHFDAEPDLILLGRWEEDYWNTVVAQTQLFPEAMKTLGELNRKYRLAIITNTQGQKRSREHRISRFPGLDQFFQEVIVAGEFGVPAKPDPVPFRLCLESLKVEPGEAVYVGDDWRIDICGARDVGIQPIWLQHHAVGRSWPVVDITVPVITSLDQLFDLETILP